MNDNRRMPARLSAFVIWALIAATAVFWGLRLFVQPATAPLHSVAMADALAGRSDLSRLLGQAPVAATVAVAAPEAASRFRLLGIMAPRHPSSAGAPLSSGLALIAVDGKPARAFVVGSRLEGDLVLQSVSLRQVSIGPAKGAHTMVLEIPPFAAPATGTSPVAGGPAPSAVGVAQPVPAVPAMAPMGMPQPALPMPPSGPVQRDGGAATQ